MGAGWNRTCPPPCSVIIDCWNQERPGDGIEPSFGSIPYRPLPVRNRLSSKKRNTLNQFTLRVRHVRTDECALENILGLLYDNTSNIPVGRNHVSLRLSIFQVYPTQCLTLNSSNMFSKANMVEDSQLNTRLAPHDTMFVLK